MSVVPDNANNRSVAAILMRQGGVVAFPTDTVYGLGGNVYNHAAVSTVFVMKGRDRAQGLPVLIASTSQLREVAESVSDEALELAERFWPGSLTLVVPRHPRFPRAVTGGADTVAVRLPDHPCPQSLISALGAPITGTSANRHGGIQPTTAAEVHRQLGSRISMVLDGGPSATGISSTILDMTTFPATLLRQGDIAVDALREVCAVVDPASVDG